MASPSGVIRSLGLDRLTSGGNFVEFNEIEADTFTLGLDEQTVRVMAPGADTSLVVLPNITLAAGRIYSIECTGVNQFWDEAGEPEPEWVDGDGDVSVVLSDGSTDAISDLLTAAGDKVVLFCTGYSWCILAMTAT